VEQVSCNSYRRSFLYDLIRGPIVAKNETDGQTDVWTGHSGNPEIRREGKTSKKSKSLESDFCVVSK
jgi:hypothetical protein